MDHLHSNMLQAHAHRLDKLEATVKDLGDKIDRLYSVLVIKERPPSQRGEDLMEVVTAFESVVAGVIDLQESRQDMSTRLDSVEHRLSNMRNQGETY